MMKEISPVNITDNAVELIGHKWMLITAGDRESFNLMIDIVLLRADLLCQRHIQFTGQIPVVIFDVDDERV